LEIDGVVFTVIRSSRKTVGVTVEPDGSPVLRTPRNATEEQIRNLVSKRMGWVNRKLRLTQQNSQNSFHPKFDVGTQLPYLGRFHSLTLSSDIARFGLLRGVFSIPKGRKDCIKEDVIKWYKNRAKVYLNQRIEKLQENYQESPKSIRILDLKGRWASCSEDKTINLNWKLVLLPTRLIDYVLHHELCHLKFHDHSNRYWRHLAKKCSNWKKLSQELEEKGVRYYLSSVENNPQLQSLVNDTSS